MFYVQEKLSQFLCLRDLPGVWAYKKLISQGGLQSATSNVATIGVVYKDERGSILKTELSQTLCKNMSFILTWR